MMYLQVIDDLNYRLLNLFASDFLLAKSDLRDAFGRIIWKYSSKDKPVDCSLCADSIGVSEPVPA